MYLGSIDSADLQPTSFIIGYLQWNSETRQLFQSKISWLLNRKRNEKRESNSACTKIILSLPFQTT